MESKFPHCDNLMLHAPKECVYCDNYPDQQQNRIVNRINFTGHYVPDLAPCPAETRRNLKDINKWYGNQPIPYHHPPHPLLTRLQRIAKDIVK